MSIWFVILITIYIVPSITNTVLFIKDIIREEFISLKEIFVGIFVIFFPIINIIMMLYILKLESGNILFKNPFYRATKEA